MAAHHQAKDRKKSQIASGRHALHSPRCITWDTLAHMTPQQGFIRILAARLAPDAGFYPVHA